MREWDRTVVSPRNGNTYCKTSRKLGHYFLGSAIRRHWPGEEMFYYRCHFCGLIHLTRKKIRSKRLPAYP